jgi:nucleoside-diphosphate-sugar epimerase
MAKVFITGADGFTGRYLAKELIRDGYEVCGLARKADSNVSWRLRVCDLLDREALTETLAIETPDAVVYQTNVVGTRNLLEALTKSGCKPQSVLLASSANVYGNTDREVIDESVKPEPANDYAISKLAMEFVARLWEGKLPITIARPFNYTGVGQSSNFLLPKIVSHFRDKAPVLELGNLHVIRDFSDVRTVVSAYSRLLTGKFSGRTFNVCSGVGYSLLDIIAIMRGLTVHHPEIRVNFDYVRANEVHKLIGSNGELRTAIGALQPIPLRETLRWMLEHPTET